MKHYTITCKKCGHVEKSNLPSLHVVLQGKQKPCLNCEESDFEDELVDGMMPAPTCPICKSEDTGCYVIGGLMAESDYAEEIKKGTVRFQHWMEPSHNFNYFCNGCKHNW